MHTGHPKPACAMCALTCLLCAMRFVMCAVRCAMCSLRKCSAQLATVRCAMCATFLRAKKRIHRQSAQRTEHKSKRKSKKCIARRRTHIAQRTSHATSHSAQHTHASNLVRNETSRAVAAVRQPRQSSSTGAITFRKLTETEMTVLLKSLWTTIRS